MMAIRCLIVFRFGDNEFCFDDNMASLDYQIRVRSLTGFNELVRSLGGAPERLLAELGLSPNLLDDPDASLPLARMGGLLAHAARALGVPDFGMRLAQYQDLSVVGSIAIIALNSPTLGAAIRSLARYWAYHTPGGIISVTEDDSEAPNLEIRYEINIADEEARRQGMELSFVVLLSFIRLYALKATTHARVTFRHAQALDGRIYRKHLRCPVRFEQDFNAVVLPLNMANAPLISNANDELRAVAERYINSVVRRFPLDIGNQVRTLAERQLANGSTTIKQIAAQLNFHPRTLQRRLADQGLSYDQLIDELRKERAQELLVQHAIPLSQVGELVGYGKQSTFVQACHRWFGLPPGAIRSPKSLSPADQK
jgi:AraC-like DNA-binding protein